MMPPARPLHRPAKNLCFRCQNRLLQIFSRQGTGKAVGAAAESESESKSKPAAVDPRRNPLRLTRVIGVTNAPAAGENTGSESRTWRQRKSDWINHEKNRQEREELTKKLASPYFRDWMNMQYQKGKTFVAPPKPFRADRALYFPNVHGRTLASMRASDTTPLLQNRLSIVSVFSSAWAERQVGSFVDGKQNPGLDEMLRADGGGGGGGAAVGLVDVNVEEGWMKALLVRLFAPLIRRKVPRERHPRYFLIRKGLSDDLKDAIALLNRKVGYVYLVDGECKIRWAGSGVATAEEKESMVHCLRRLLLETKKLGGAGPEKELLGG